MNEVQINKIKKRADEYATSCFPYEKQFLEREAVVKCCVHVVTETIAELEKENAELSEKLNRHKHDCPNCSAFGKHCPHRVNGDPYTYDCYLTVAELEKENAELKADNDARKFAMAMSEKVEKQLREENAELEAQIERMKCCENCNNFMHRIDHRCNTKCKNLSEWERKEK